MNLKIPKNIFLNFFKNPFKTHKHLKSLSQLCKKDIANDVLDNIHGCGVVDQDQGLMSMTHVLEGLMGLALNWYLF